MLRIGRKLKGIFRATPELTANTTIEKAITDLASYICKVSECDRSTIYAIDHDTQELWSKSSIGDNQTIFRVPIGSGIAGSCAELNKTINILDAYNDKRFNKEFDKKTGYRTKSIISIPIRSKTGHIEGVIQAINKLNISGTKVSMTSFNIEDQGMLEMLAELAGLFFKSSVDYSEQTYQVNNFRQIIKLGVMLSKAKDILEVCKVATTLFLDFFGSPNMRIYLLDNDTKNLYFYNENNEKIVVPPKVGLIRCCMKGIIRKLPNPCNHKSFNGSISLI